ncbi:MAG: ABC transporter ATP-binding protein [Hyphomicrobiales bacterium]|nr:ABC transporter ATP-binding protein [Hyphomicrobiales bacterium]
MSLKLESIARQSDDFASLIIIFKSYFKKFAGQYAIIAGLIVVTSAATGLSAWYVKDIVNTLFVENKFQHLYIIVIGVIVLFCVRGLATYWQSVLMMRISAKIIANIQSRIFAHILQQRIRFYEKYTSDTLIMLVNQGAMSFNSILTRVVLNGVRDIATVLGLVIVMILQDPILTLICATVVPPVFWAVNILLRRIKTLSEQEMQSVTDLNRYMREAVQGAKVIKAFNLQHKIQTDARTVIRALQHRTNLIAQINEAPVPILDTLGGVAVAMAILYAGLRSSYGGYDVGTFMSFLTALLLAADPGRRISQLRVNLRKSLIGVRMVYTLLDEHDNEPVGCGASVSSGNLGITFSGVKFAYRDGVDIVHTIDLHVKPGEILALVGPSGAGKSTILNLLLKLYEPGAGQIMIGGVEITDWSTSALRANIAYVGQSNFIFSGTVRENLCLSLGEISNARLDEVCESVGLIGFIAGLQQGYDTQIGELGSSISGGQAQRLNIARAILKDAPILLLDEATSALDAENEALVKSYVAAQRGKKTMIIIAHRLSTVRNADRIAVLDNGVLTAAGRHSELLASNVYYNKVVSLQLTG